MSKNALQLVKKRRRKRLYIKFALVFFVLLMMFSAGLFGLFNFEEFKISSIEVRGVPEHQKNLLLAEVAGIMSAKKFWVIPQDRIFSFPTQNTQTQLIEKFLNLKEILVIKESTDIFIQAKERKPVAILCKDEFKDCLFVDKTGFIYSEAPLFSAGIFIKLFDERSIRPSLGQFLLPEEKFQNLLVFKKVLDDFFIVESVYLDKENVYRFYFEGGSYIIVDNDDNWETTVNNFNVFYKDFDGQEFEYIDLRFGNKVYYK